MFNLLLTIISVILVYFVGAAIGSFLMVVIRRGHNNQDWVHGRSVCESCGKELKWWEMIPSFSYIMLGGKCSRCKAKIDSSHFIGETGLGIIYTIVFVRYLLGYCSPIQTVILFVAYTVLWKAVMSDILYKEISSIDVYIAATVISIVTGCLISTVILIILAVTIFGKDNLKCLGAGDIDILILIYAAVGGIIPIISVLLYASLIAIVVYYLLIRKQEDKRIPFVPFLFCGFVLVSLGLGLL